MIIRSRNAGVLLAAVAIVLVGHPAGATPAVFHTDRAAFEALYGGLPLESFEDANVVPGGAAVCQGPADASTNNECFSSGDIEPGLVVETATPVDPWLAVLGAGYANVPSNSVWANLGNGIALEFPNGETIVGADVQSLYSDDVCQVGVFGAGMALLGSTTTSCTRTGVFIGVVSEEPIFRLEVSAPANFEGFDNVVFGTPIPTTLGAHPAVASLAGPAVYLALSATLTETEGGAPVVGVPIAFSVGAAPVCSATTGPNGTASCGGPAEAVSAALNGGYTASFAGAGEHMPSSGSGGVVG